MKNLTLQRVAAVDVFRALTMFLMLFVNDIPGLKNVPHWLMHAAADEDMLGFSDTIFPAFLFCMGMSVSFAIQNRYKKERYNHTGHCTYILAYGGAHCHGAVLA